MEKVILPENSSEISYGTAFTEAIENRNLKLKY